MQSIQTPDTKLKAKALGFTLVEMLVVISVIALLATLLIVNLNSARSRARDAERKTDLDQIKKALRMYYNNYRAYPAASGGAIVGCGAAGDQACSWGGFFGNQAADDYYMKILPTDPTVGVDYAYVQLTSETFCLSANLENAADASISQSQSRCSACAPFGGSQYVVCED